MRRLVNRLRRGARAERLEPHSLREKLDWLLIGTAILIGTVMILIIVTATLEPRQQALLGISTALIFLVANRWKDPRVTMFLVILSAAVSLRYIFWRLTDTIDFSTPLEGFLGTGLALAEIYAIIVLGLGYIQTAWILERPPVPLPLDVDLWPSVDIYIPTYNEDLAVVRATVLAALTVDWPRDRLNVYILDDGRRDEFRDFAAACGAGYLVRPDNSHAKAGNINHALTKTTGEFIAIFDCDHVPNRAFLQLTMGWMVREPNMALIQTPHHFYSPDPFQRNLTAGKFVPAEGNMFYHRVQAGNDFWNATFFCGSCAVIRRSALEQIGGIAVETVTEDAHTALRLHRLGWDSAYLRLPLAAGLATERLMLHIGQRVRWARGMIQIFRLDNPLFGPGLTLVQRLCYLNAMTHFMFAIPRFVFLTSPLAFLLLGQNIIAASPLAIVAYAFPHIFHSMATASRLEGTARHSFWSEIYETVLAMFLIRLTIMTLWNPREGKFNVTAKGGTLEEGYYDYRAVYPNIILAVALLVGLLRGLFGLGFEVNDDTQFQALLLNSVWVTINLLIVLASLALGRESRQLRGNARVPANLPVTLRLPDRRSLPARSRDLSQSGAGLELEETYAVPAGTMVQVRFQTGGEEIELSARVQRGGDKNIGVGWQLDDLNEESQMVRLVFGRADAWTYWDQFNADRPMQSLLRVLGSIAGLFRPSDPRAAPPPPAAAAAAGEAPARTTPAPTMPATVTG